MTKVHFKITSPLIERVRHDLARPHPFALERVGFVACRAAQLDRKGFIILAVDYLPLDDGDYLESEEFGALMGPSGIRKALQHAYQNPVGMFHVHMHGGRGLPSFSRIDEREMRKFVPNFFNARATLPHGALVLSSDSAIGYCWTNNIDKPLKITRFVMVGRPMRELGDKP